MAKADESIWKRWDVMILLFIVVIALVGAGAYAAYGAMSTIQESTEPGLTVHVGDQITVEYIWQVLDGSVFLKDIQNVAENNKHYPNNH